MASLGAATLPAAGDSRTPHAASLALLHRVAQAAHTLAQGKVGSGFDVCSAVLGSCRYVRFPPEVLGAALAAALPTDDTTAAAAEEATGAKGSLQVGAG